MENREKWAYFKCPRHFPALLLLISLAPIANSRNYHLEVGVASGVGQFQDLQTPASPILGLRSDGMRNESAGDKHISLPIFFRTQFLYKKSIQHNLGLDFHFLQMKALSGPSSSGNSSLEAFRVDPFYTYLWSPSLSFKGSLLYRRSYFSNGSSVHDYYSFLPKFSLKKTFYKARLALDLSYGRSIYTAFAFKSHNERNIFKLKRSLVHHLEGELSYALAKKVFLFMLLSYEKFQASYDPKESYKRSDLSLTSELLSKENLNVETSYLSFGLKKIF